MVRSSSCGLRVTPIDILAGVGVASIAAALGTFVAHVPRWWARLNRRPTDVEQLADQIRATIADEAGETIHAVKQLAKQVELLLAELRRYLAEMRSRP